MDVWKKCGSMPCLYEIDEVRKKWGWFFALGLLLIVGGALVINFSFYATLFTVIFLGFFIFAAGIVQIIQAGMAHKWKGLFPSLLLGLLYLVVGFLFVAKPGVTAMSLTLLMAAFFFIAGLFRMISALFMRFNHWGWVFFNGLISFILGILIFSEWPVSGLWLIGLFLGIDMILQGISWTVMSLAVKKSK